MRYDHPNQVNDDIVSRKQVHQDVGSRNLAKAQGLAKGTGKPRNLDDCNMAYRTLDVY